MGFIEKITAVMNGTTTEQTDPATTAAEPDQRGDHPTELDKPAAEGTNPQPEQTALPTTPEEMEQFLTAKRKEWTEEQEAKEQERLRYLPERERQRQEQLAKEKELADLKAELARRDMQAAVIAKLEEKRLPASVAELVQYGDEQATMESLDKVCGIIETMVLEGINLRLRGKTPEGLGMAAHRENVITDAFARAFMDTSKK